MKDIVQEYLERYNTGFPTFEKLFNLKKDELIEVLKGVCIGNKNATELLKESPNVYKFIENDLPTKIKLCSWSTLEITPTGIFYKPEHGQGDDVINFNKFFVIDI